MILYRIPYRIPVKPYGIYGYRRNTVELSHVALMGSFVRADVLVWVALEIRSYAAEDSWLA